MTGLKSQDLMSMINFIYTGETEVAQDNLGYFMGIAAKFKVKVLTEGNKYDFKRVTRSPGVIETQEQDSKCTQQFISKTNISEEDSHIANHVMESVIIHESKEVNLNISNNLQSNLFNDSESSALIENTDMTIECDQCDYITTTRSNLRRHKKAKHDGIKFPCTKCDYKASYSHNLQQHIACKHSKLYRI